MITFRRNGMHREVMGKGLIASVNRADPSLMIVIEHISA